MEMEMNFRLARLHLNDAYCEVLACKRELVHGSIDKGGNWKETEFGQAIDDAEVMLNEAYEAISYLIGLAEVAEDET